MKLGIFGGCYDKKQVWAKINVEQNEEDYEQPDSELEKLGSSQQTHTSH